MTAVPPANPHTLLEDAQALFIGTLLVAYEAELAPPSNRA